MHLSVDRIFFQGTQTEDGKVNLWEGLTYVRVNLFIGCEFLVEVTDGECQYRKASATIPFLQDGYFVASGGGGGRTYRQVSPYEKV